MKQIKLANNKGFVLIDDEDFDELSKHKWSLEKRRYTSYARTNIKINGSWKVFRMHHVLMGVEKGREIDHKDGNGLNNTRQNLRFGTRSQNCMNMRKTRGTSLYKGVYRKNAKWQAQITKDGKGIYLGSFDSEITAAKAYDKKAQELFGEFSRLNFRKVG